MTVRYVGPGGSDAADGLTWETRKLTLNGVEASPVAPGDVVYVAPGVYRESFIPLIAGLSGNPISFIADVTGEHTDGIGGAVVISGSDDDFTPLRARAIDADPGVNFRTFRGFGITGFTDYGFYIDECTDWVLEDIYLWDLENASTSNAPVRLLRKCYRFTIRRCVFMLPHNNSGIYLYETSALNDAGHLIENCLFVRGYIGVRTDFIGGITVRNCTFYGQINAAVRVSNALSAGQTVQVYNCLITSCSTGLYGFTLGDLVEDYNNIYACNASRNTVNVGANSVDGIPGFVPMILTPGIKLPTNAHLFELSSRSQFGARAGQSYPTEDLYGIARPSANGKNSWGAFQQQRLERETGTVRGGVGASLGLPDAGRVQFHAPVSSGSTTVQVYVYREADYAGNAPQMVIKQPGQADVVVTDGGAAGQWNKLETTITPAAVPGYAIVELGSNNTATSGSYAVYFDDLDVS